MNVNNPAVQPGTPTYKYEVSKLTPSTSVVLWGDNTYVSDIDQYTQWQTAHMENQLVFSQTVIGGRELKVFRVKDFYMYDLKVFNVTKPYSNNTPALTQSNQKETYFMFVLNEKVNSVKIKSIYKRRTFENLYDEMHAFSMLPSLAYVTSDAIWVTTPYNGGGNIEMPTAEDIGERYPQKIIEMIDSDNQPLRHQIASNLGAFAKVDGTAVPPWAVLGEGTNLFRNLKSIILPEEVAKMSLSSSTISIETQSLNDLLIDLNNESSQTRSINVEKTEEMITGLSRNDVRSEPYQWRVSRRVPPRRVSMFVQISNFFNMIVFESGMRRISPMSVVTSPRLRSIAVNAAFATAQGVLITSNGTVAGPNINIYNLVLFEKSIAVALYNPTCIKIDLLNINDNMIHIQLLNAMFMGIAQSCIFRSEGRTLLCNAIYSGLYFSGAIINIVGLPHPSTLQNRSINALNALFGTIANQAPQLVNFLTALVDQRPNQQNNWWMFGGGQAPNTPLLNDPLFVGAQPSPTCVRPDQVQQYLTKIGNIINTFSQLRNIQNYNLEPALVDQICNLLNTYAQGMVCAFRDAGMMTGSASCESVWADIAERNYPNMLTNLVPLSINAMMGTILANDDDVYPIYSIQPDNPHPVDSMNFVYTVARTLRQKAMDQSWRETIDNTIEVLKASGAELDPTFFDLLYESQVRASLRNVVGYALPPIYTEFLARQQAMLPLVKALKPQMGFSQAFFVTFCKAQYFMRYPQTDATNALDPNIVQAIMVYNNDTLYTAMRDIHVDPNQQLYATRRLTEFEWQMQRLKRMGVPTIAQIGAGARIPVILFNIPCIVETQVRVVSRLDEVGNGEIFNPQTFKKDILIENGYPQVKEDIGIFSGIAEESQEVLDMSNQLPNPVTAPLLDLSRVRMVSVQAMMASVQTTTTRKKEYKFVPSYDVFVERIRYGTV